MDSAVVLNVVDTKSKIEYKVWNKDNPFPDWGAPNHEKRTAGTVPLVLSHATDKLGNVFGCFDQSLAIEHDFDVAVGIKIYAGMYDSSGIRWLYQVLDTTMAAPGTGSNRLTLTPEHGNVVAAANRHVEEIAEFRQPIPVFEIQFIYKAAPTTGSLKLYSTRRF